METIINHPKHYNTGKYECIDVMIEVFGVKPVQSFCLCNAFKYIYRAKRKNGVEDIKKASWYLNKFLELENKMTGNEYQKAAMRTANGKPNILEGVLGLCGESGECADHVKKATFQGHELDKIELAEELGDVAWYLAMSADSIGYDLDKIFEINIEKLKRRYPNGFESKRSTNREEYKKK